MKRAVPWKSLEGVKITSPLAPSTTVPFTASPTRHSRRVCPLVATSTSLTEANKVAAAMHSGESSSTDCTARGCATTGASLTAAMVKSTVFSSSLPSA